MIKKFLYLLVMIILMFSLSSCGKKQVKIEVIPIDMEIDSSVTQKLEKEGIDAVKNVTEYFNFKKVNDINVFIQNGMVSSSDNTGITFANEIVMANEAPVVHEITHSLCRLQPSINQDYKFFTEGIAVMMEELYGNKNAFPYKYFRLRNSNSMSVLDIMNNIKNDYIPLSELKSSNKNFSTEMNKEKKTMEIRRISYLESGAFFLFLNDKYGKEKIRELYKSSKVLDFEGVFGKNLEELEKEFKQYYKI